MMTLKEHKERAFLLAFMGLLAIATAITTALGAAFAPNASDPSRAMMVFSAIIAAMTSGIAATISVQDFNLIWKSAEQNETATESQQTDPPA